MYCMHCGSELKENAKFCSKCGQPTVNMETGDDDAQRDMDDRGYDDRDNYDRGYDDRDNYDRGYDDRDNYDRGYDDRDNYDRGYDDRDTYDRYDDRDAGRRYDNRDRAPRRERSKVHINPGNLAKKGIKLPLLIGIIAAVVAVILIIVLVVVPAVSGRSIEQTVKQLETAMNELDTEKMLDCFDQDTQDLYSGLSSVAEGLVDGLDMGGLEDLASGLGGILGGTGLLPETTITIEDIEETGNGTCNVTLYMEISYESFGYSDSEEMTLPMKKEGNNWCFTSGFDSLYGSIS